MSCEERGSHHQNYAATSPSQTAIAEAAARSPHPSQGQLLPSRHRIVSPTVHPRMQPITLSSWTASPTVKSLIPAR